MTHPAPNSELTGESVKLLKAGDVLRSNGGATCQFVKANAFLLTVKHGIVKWADDCTRFTFIGRPDLTSETIAEGDARMANADAYDAAVAVAGARERLEKVLAGTSAWKTYAHHLGESFPEDLRLILSAYDRQGEEIERLRDKVEGLDSDLRSAVEVAYQRGAHEWASLNYPQWIVWLQRNAAARARQGGSDHG